MSSDYEKITADNLRRRGTDFDDIGRFLAEQLYSDRTHFVYELIQNADDAISRLPGKVRTQSSYRKLMFRLYEDRLEAIHRGKPFDEEDVRGISDILKGTKSQDETQIGRFGIGFKSVYAFTRSPEIHSGDERFSIERYIRPRQVEADHKLGDHTLFIIPFDHDKISASKANEEIKDRLEDLGLRTMLFLRNIDEISWEREGAECNRYSRSVRKRGAARQVRLTETFYDVVTAQEDWLVFSRPASRGRSRGLQVEVAFLLAREEGRKAQIVPVDESPLVAFFPTEKETHLGFLVQGPYVPTPARDNVLADEPYNHKLMESTAKLVAESLAKIRDMGYLTVSFLKTLPLERYNFEDTFFEPIFEAVVNELEMAPLLPTEDGTHVSARNAILARCLSLPQLLSSRQMNQLLGGQSARSWLSNEIGQYDSEALYDYLVEELGVFEFGWDEFAERFTAAFAKKQPDKWLVALYGALEEDKLNRMHTAPIVRLEDGRHVTPFDNEGHPNAYLPGNGQSSFPLIKQQLVLQPKVRRYFENIGITEPDNVADVIDQILPKYKDDKVGFSSHKQHFKTILRALGQAQGERRETLLDVLPRIPFIRCTNAAGDIETYLKPSEAYVRSPDLEAYFDGNPEAWFLNEMYRDHIRSLMPLGVRTHVEVTCRSPEHDGHVMLISEPGRHERGLDGFDCSCHIDGLEYAVVHPTASKARFIWNHLIGPLADQIRGVVERCPRQSFNDTDKEERWSTMGQAVRDAAWLPDRNGAFHRPADISIDELPCGFRPNFELERQLGMKSSARGQVAMTEDIDPELLNAMLDLAKAMPNEFREKIAELSEQRQLLFGQVHDELEEDAGEFDYKTELYEGLNCPGRAVEETQRPSTGPVGNPERRRSKIDEELAESREIEPLAAARVKYLMAARYESRNEEARHFLEEEYDGRCQICSEKNSFRKRNGRPYFEAPFLVSRRKAGWIDRPGNVLSLCATCCAKWHHGARKVDPEAVLEKVQQWKAENEGGTGNAEITIELCDEPVRIYYSERHMIELQQLLAAKVNGKSSGGHKSGTAYEYLV